MVSTALTNILISLSTIIVACLALDRRSCINVLPLHFYPGFNLLKQDYYVTADSNRFQKSAYVSMQVQRCPRLLHLLLVLIHWGRRRHLVGNSKRSFLSDENLATLFLVFCEESDLINKVSLWLIRSSMIFGRRIN